ncbi:hypothetical protein GW764_01340 [Candidatus Parcubacteria bacterium]|nr:hypothetical protein [Candidatus Parcubacteria bacterium]
MKSLVEETTEKIIKVGIKEQIKIKFCSENRRNTSIEVFDKNGESMDRTSIEYASMRIENVMSWINEINNILLMDEDVSINQNTFKEYVLECINLCEAKYGHSTLDGDAFINIL